MGATEEPAGWYLDPVPGAPDRQHRYWTGTTWTHHVATRGPGARTPGAGGGIRGRHDWRIPLVAAGLIVLILAGALGIRTLRSDDRYPESWDPQVAPIAARSRRSGASRSSTRSACATSPMPQFRRKVGVETLDLSPAARRKIRQLAGTLRALGLLDADADLVKSFDTANQSGVVAFYDPEQRGDRRARHRPARRRAQGDARPRAHARAAGPALRSRTRCAPTRDGLRRPASSGALDRV